MTKFNFKYIRCKCKRHHVVKDTDDQYACKCTPEPLLTPWCGGTGIQINQAAFMAVADKIGMARVSEEPYNPDTRKLEMKLEQKPDIRNETQVRPEMRLDIEQLQMLWAAENTEDNIRKAFRQNARYMPVNEDTGRKWCPRTPEME